MHQLSTSTILQRKFWTVEVSVETKNEQIYAGTGSDFEKRIAEQSAARELLMKLESRKKGMRNGSEFTTGEKNE